MLPFALNAEGKPVYPERLSEAEWLRLKETYQVGSLTTPCCNTPAVPKTSLYGVQFFAHMSDECATSPEGQWHLVTKDLLIKTLQGLGLDPVLEHPLKGPGGRSKADVYFEASDGRRFAIEVQHAYQTLGVYLKRQEKYQQMGVANFWLLYRPSLLTLIKSMARLRLRRDFGGVFPPGSYFPFLPELPVAEFNLEQEEGLVLAGRHLSATLHDWLRSVLDGSYQYDNGMWRVIKR